MRVVLVLLSWFSLGALGAPAHVEVTESRLFVDGRPAPFLFGAELQYFRARGGPGPNLPADTVKALWERLLDRAAEAGMNAVTFYIPWDFHEPEDGVFDFDGTLDRDGDGRPDYPSRDLKGFLKLLVSRGVRHIMVRPGPYINAEWGPTGFGAVPKWFLEKHPEALAVTRSPNKPRTVTFGHPLFRARARRWLETLHREVLADYMGPGKPIVFLQLDNETNYFWDSLYERDYSSTSLDRFRAWLKTRYWFPPWRDAPTDPAQGDPRWHYDWQLFHDVEIRDYYRFLRKVWSDLGVTEPHVLVTSCDSYNAPAWGLLPRLDFRQEGRLSLTTMNIYPKTFGTQAESTMNAPMKAAHDARLVAASHRRFYGTAGDWVMSTETVGGWFPPVEVGLATRQHTYGSLLGSGVKSLIVYYFHEGWNWDGRERADSELHFDAPLDKDMNPRPAFSLLRELGQELRHGLGDLIVESRPVEAKVLIAHDSRAQYRLPGGPDAVEVSSTDSAALFGLFREAGVMPVVDYADRMSLWDLSRYRLVVWKDAGSSAAFRRKLEAYRLAGGHLVEIGAGDPARGWNGDDYLRLPKAEESIAWAREQLEKAGVPRQVEVTAADGEPFVHAWLRAAPDGGRLLLFVENFARRERRVTVRLHPSVRPKAAEMRLKRRFGDHGPGRSVEPDGFELPVRADGIDLWELTFY